MKKSIAVMGLGKYGKSLVEKLYRMGADVMAVDADEEAVREIAGKCTSGICANLENEREVSALGLKHMDIVVSAIGNNLAASITVVSVAKEQGVPLVIAKSSSEHMSSVLMKVRADRIIDPEGEGGMRLARILISSSFKDFYEIDENMYVIETQAKKEWVGKNLVELELRKSMNVNVIAVKEPDHHWHFVNPKAPLTADSVLLIAVERKDMDKWK